MDGETSYAVGRAFARVLAELRGKPTGELRVGLGRDMRLQAPEMARRLRDGLVDEGCTVLDAGMVGTEMLYFLVGSHELDGGAMVTASHNPKAYTGVKLVREGALALSGDAGIGEIRDLVLGGLPDPPGGGSVEAVDVYDEFQRARALADRPGEGRAAEGGRRRRQRDGGPDGRPAARAPDLDLVETYWVPDGEFPDHEPNPLLPENRQFVIDRVLDEGADLGIAWDGDADRCFFIDDTGDLRRRRLPHRAARPPGAGEAARRDDPLRRPRQPRGPRHGRASRAAPRRSTASATPSSRSRCASTAARSAARSRATTTSATSGARTPGRSPPCSCSRCSRSRAGRSRSSSASLRERYFISGEINSEVADQEAKMKEIAEAHSDAEITWLDGVSVDYPDWHFNVRPSNTEPLLRLNLESLVSREDMERRRDEVLALIRS